MLTLYGQYSIIRLEIKVKRFVLLCCQQVFIPQGPVDDLECTEVSPELADTRSPPHQSEPPKYELHNRHELSTFN